MRSRILSLLLLLTSALGTPAAPLREALDAPLLFVKRQPYWAGHIYDDYYTWHPGGGIYLLENPADPPEKHRVRALIDPTTAATLGVGVYREPDLSWDATRVVFAFKGEANGGTSLYEIGIDGTGLRRLTTPETACPVTACRYAQDFPGHHDIAPCYLPDGRIAFTSTRSRARVPCFNSAVDVLHVLDPASGAITCLSVNNVNEFDPSVLPDGRILFGRWEYVDKTALYMQSLWTMRPDGTEETAFFANNLAKPTAVLDARAVPGTGLVVASLTPHNGQSVGAIALIDPALGKNNLQAITNLTPEFPTEMDQGIRRGFCDPWPLSRDLVLAADNTTGEGVIKLLHRDGRRETVVADPAISCYSPMLVKPRIRPPVVASTVGSVPASFFVRDVQRGLPGIEPGTVRWLRVIEETARVSEIPPGGRWWNQAFLVSWQGAYIVKNILGVVPVEPDGSAHFVAPPGKALYFQALDEQGRALQSMRTFVQARPGVTRSCVGCHESKAGTAPNARLPLAAGKAPATLAAESWGNGWLDYPSMVQPVLDRNCVSCHGGERGIAAGLDLSGGWTWAFNLSYETLIRNTLVGFLNCNNGSVETARILPPKTHGSGAAPLTQLLLSGHQGRIKEMTETEIRLVLAWMDTNSNYHGVWDWTPQATCEPILTAGAKLSVVMRERGCVQCHAPAVGADWINLEHPERSRILRAPLPADSPGLGLGWCRERKAQTVAPLVTQRDQPPDVFRPVRVPPRDASGTMVSPFASPADAGYQAMLQIIREARTLALADPRVDLPGAAPEPGEIRHLVPPAAPAIAPPLQADLAVDGTVQLRWSGGAELIGLSFAVHRGPTPDFTPTAETLVGTTPRFALLDPAAPAGIAHYALAVGDAKPSRISLTVPAPEPVPTVPTTQAEPLIEAIRVRWEAVPWPGVRYCVFRAPPDGDTWSEITAEPLTALALVDLRPNDSQPWRYAVRAVDRRGRVGELGPSATAAALPAPIEPILRFPLGATSAASVQAGARVVGADIDLAKGGFVLLPDHADLTPQTRFTACVRVRFDRLAPMPVVLAHGNWNQDGWFLQAIGGRWRWHTAQTSCDGGKIVTGRWIALAAVYDLGKLRLYVDGELVAQAECPAAPVPFRGPLTIGQYTQRREDYQVFGTVRALRIYRRALPTDEIQALAATE